MIPEAVVERIRAAGRILISSHANPDGDAIASELGLARVLAGLGKRTAIWNLHPVPALFAVLPGAEEIVAGDAPPPGFPDAFDLVVVLECPTLDRTGLEGALAARPMVNIDHHLGNDGYGEASWVDAEQPAVGVMVAELATALGGTIDTQTANCLLVALVTDTGGFRFANSTPEAFEAAARLLRLGAEIETVSRWLYERQPETAVRLLGELLATLRRHHDGRIATVHLTRAMFARSGAAPGDSEGLIDTPRTIDGVEAVALFRELEVDSWKISLRSRGALDVQQIARRFGGGGHVNAAGCRFTGTLAEAERTFVDELARACAEAT
jgi:bifunctional oligoribonuclease and PAP phosphatase NrnA